MDVGWSTQEPFLNCCFFLSKKMEQKKRKREMGNGGDVHGAIRSQLRHADNEYGMSTTPSVGASLPSDGSDRKTIGSSNHFAHMNQVAPEWRGLGPSTTAINNSALLNPRMAVPNLASKHRTRVSVNDTAELSGDDDSNPKVDVGFICLEVFADLASTWRAVGITQFVFIHVPPRVRFQNQYYQPMTPQDAKLVSPGIVNTIFEKGGECVDGATPYTASDPSKMIQEWRPFGVCTGIQPVSEDAGHNRPLVSLVVSRYVKVINYWAACEPQPQAGSYCYFLLVRRPRDSKKRAEYRDWLRELRQIELAGMHGPEVTKRVVQLRRKVNDWDAQWVEEKAKDLNCLWCWEPWVETSSALPASSYWSGVGWRGQPALAVIALEDCGIQKCSEHYLQMVQDLMHPSAEGERWDAYETLLGIKGNQSNGMARHGLGVIGACVATCDATD